MHIVGRATEWLTKSNRVLFLCCVADTLRTPRDFIFPSLVWSLSSKLVWTDAYRYSYSDVFLSCGINSDVNRDGNHFTSQSLLNWNLPVLSTKTNYSAAPSASEPSSIRDTLSEGDNLRKEIAAESYCLFLLQNYYMYSLYCLIIFS